MDTSEIWYHMQSSVSHLPKKNQKDILEDIICQLIDSWSDEFNEEW